MGAHSGQSDVVTGMSARPTVRRLILLNTHLHMRDLPAVAEGTFGYHCFEDFSVGPLTGWPDRDRFDAGRAAFWARARVLDLPDGSQMDHFVWHQILPQFEMAEMVKMASADALPLHDFDVVAPLAEVVELWAGDSIRDRLWTWYVVTVLDQFGVGPDRVRLVDLGDTRKSRPDPQWVRRVLSAPDPDDFAPEQDRATSLRNWATTCTPPELRGATTADPALAEALRLLNGRRVDPETGMNAIRRRLLAFVRPDWTKMARIVGEAMAAGWDAGDDVGDAVLQFELEEMARLPDPPVEIEGEGAMRYCTVRLTARGTAIQGEP